MYYHGNAIAVLTAAKYTMAVLVAAALNSLRNSTLHVTEDLQDFITNFFGNTDDEFNLGTRTAFN